MGEDSTYTEGNWKPTYLLQKEYHILRLHALLQFISFYYSLTLLLFFIPFSCFLCFLTFLLCFLLDFVYIYHFCFYPIFIFSFFTTSRLMISHTNQEDHSQYININVI